jgi:hypothetical protein
VTVTGVTGAAQPPPQAPCLACITTLLCVCLGCTRSPNGDPAEARR